MNVVLDTNVLLSAFFTRGICEGLFEACLSRTDCSIILCEHILTEFTRHAQGKFGAPPGDVKAAVQFLRRSSTLFEPASLPRDACPDPEDVPILGAVIAAAADALVTGDRELLALGTIGQTPILTPRAMFDRLLP